MEKIDTSNFVDELCEINPKYDGEIKALEEKYKCEIRCDIEKHNVLQYTYFYEVNFNTKENFFVEIESGINNGTRLNHEEWGINTKSTTKIVEVLKDIKLDDSFYENGSLLKRKAQAILDVNKNKLFEFHRKDNYDNYVTGGNSKMKLDDPLQQLHLDYIYEDQEVDCTFV